jgi:hypothetical protein
MSSAPFFSALKDDHPRKAVAEDALEARGSDKAGQGEERTQRPRGLHP